MLFSSSLIITKLSKIGVDFQIISNDKDIGYGKAFANKTEVLYHSIILCRIYHSYL